MVLMKQKLWFFLTGILLDWISLKWLCWVSLQSQSSSLQPQSSFCVFRIYHHTYLGKLPLPTIGDEFLPFLWNIDEATNNNANLHFHFLFFGNDIITLHAHDIWHFFRLRSSSDLGCPLHSHFKNEGKAATQQYWDLSLAKCSRKNKRKKAKQSVNKSLEYLYGYWIILKNILI